MALVVLDIQHAGEPSRRDLGASHDLDGDGIVEECEHEARLTPIYAAAAQQVLEAAGHTVVIETAGTYASRHKRTIAAAKKAGTPAAYVACHLNAGGGDYGLVCWDYRSECGAKMAKLVGAALTLEFSSDELRRVYPAEKSACAPSKKPGALSEAWKWEMLPKYDGSVFWPRPYATISGIYRGPATLSAICFEPVFMDTHGALLDGRGLFRMGSALGLGLLQWIHWRTP